MIYGTETVGIVKVRQRYILRVVASRSNDSYSYFKISKYATLKQLLKLSAFLIWSFQEVLHLFSWSLFFMSYILKV